MKTTTIILTFLLLITLISSNLISQGKDTSVVILNWEEVKEIVSKMNESTSYADIIKLLGKPLEEYAAPSLKEEYILLYDVPGEPGYIFWIILNTEKKTFLYWSNEKVKS